MFLYLPYHNYLVQLKVEEVVHVFQILETQVLLSKTLTW